MNFPTRARRSQQARYVPSTLLIYGEIHDDELEAIKKEFEPVGITVDRPINQADWAQDILHFVFSDFNLVSYVRDGLLGVLQAKALTEVVGYFKKRSRISTQVSFDRTITHGRKTFSIFITCHYNHVSTIETQISLIVTPTVLRKLPTGSRIYVTGQEDLSIKVIVVERNTGRTYPLN